MDLFYDIVNHLPARVGPWAKLEVALLVVEGEPGDVDLAGGLEEAGGDVEAASIVAHNHICLVSPIKLLVRAGCKYYTFDSVIGVKTIKAISW